MLARHFYALMASTRIGDGPPGSTGFFYDSMFGKTVLGAWGLRKLVSTYDGPIIRVRDLSDNTETDIYAEPDGSIETPAGVNTIVFTSGVGGDSAGWGGYSFRQRIPLSNFSELGSPARLKIAAGNVTGLVVAKATVALASSSAGSLEYVGTPTELKFGGAAGFSIAANELAQCDAFVMPSLSSSDAIILTVSVTSGSFGFGGSVSGGARGYRTGDHTTTSSGSGWTSDGLLVNCVTEVSLETSVAITTIYDQSGNECPITQPTASKQPIFVPEITPVGGPALQFDGVDDFMSDPSPDTTKPYMVERPLVVYLGGQKAPREQYGKPWLIPQQAGANTNPWIRIGIEFNSVASSSLANVRVNGSETANINMFGMTSTSGWQGHALAPVLGKFLQNFSADTNVSNAVMTYPSSTGLYLNSNGEGNENNGANFVEIVIMDGTSLVQADVQDALDEMVTNFLFVPLFAIVSKMSKYVVYDRIGPLVSKLEKYSVMQRVGPGVSKLSRYTIFQAV